MRLIDADELIRNLIHVSHECDEFGRGVATGISTAITEIYKIPFLTIDDPRPKGRWIPVRIDDCFYRCSVCQFVRDAYLLDVGNYCPNCGAKMDGGED